MARFDKLPLLSYNINIIYINYNKIILLLINHAGKSNKLTNETVRGNHLLSQPREPTISHVAFANQRQKYVSQIKWNFLLVQENEKLNPMIKNKVEAHRF